MERTQQQHRIRELPVLVLFPHNRCNCRCVMCDIWKIREVRELTDRDLEPHLADFSALGVKWIVFSGGEPLMHSDLASLCRLCRHQGVRLTLLTSGLLLERHAASVAEWIDDDTFRTCVGDKERPTKFTTTGDGAGQMLLLFKRVKK